MSSERARIKFKYVANDGNTGQPENYRSGRGGNAGEGGMGGSLTSRRPRPVPRLGVSICGASNRVRLANKLAGSGATQVHLAPGTEL